MKTFVIADIHGAYKALLQCLERSQFDYKKDKLIVLGDTCDGWAQVKECFDELLKIKHLIYILGNHDEWALEWYDREYKDNPYIRPENIWTSQGGRATLKSYKIGSGYDGELLSQMPETHMDLLRKAKLYYIEDNNIFVHGGIREHELVEETNRNVFLWDRDLLHRCYGVHHYNPKFKIQNWDTIFIGHTNTLSLEPDMKPVFACNLINLDTGAGWNGKLTIMNVKTKEYWQSDVVKTLYPDVKGR